MRKGTLELLGRSALLATVAMLMVGCNASVVAPAASPTATPIVAAATVGSVTSTFVPTQEAATATQAVLATGTAPAATSTAPADPTSTATPHPAVTAILAYLVARARTDVAAATALSCKAWKPQAVTEAISFRSMNARLAEVVCQVTGSAGGFSLVGCRGKIVTTYGTESRDWDLSAFVYQVTMEDGQWKMCGYH